MVELKVTESSRKQEETFWIPQGLYQTPQWRMEWVAGRTPCQGMSGMLNVPHLMTNAVEGRTVKEMSQVTGRDVVVTLNIPRGMIPRRA